MLERLRHTIDELLDVDLGTLTDVLCRHMRHYASSADKERERRTAHRARRPVLRVTAE